MTNSLNISKIRPVAGTSRNIYAVLILCLSIFICYSNSFHNGFVDDDHYIIELNQDPLSFHSAIKALISMDNLTTRDPMPYYRPLTRFSFFVDQYVFGLVPMGYHAVNISLHVMCAVLLYFVLLALECGFAASFGAALLFGVHPINAEPVNFTSGRNNILAAIFVLGSLLASLKAEERKKNGLHFLSGFLFFLGMLSKETALMLIPFLIFLKLYKERSFREPKSILKWDTKFIFSHVLFLGVYILLHLFAIDSRTPLHIKPIGLWLHELVYIIPGYLSIIVIPRGLSFLHLVPKDFHEIVLPLMLKWLAFLALMFYIIKKRNRTTDLGIAWLLINSIPISNIISIPSPAMAERYMYLPMIGFLIVAADLLNRLFSRNGAYKPAIWVFLSLAAILGVVTFNKNFDWRDDLSLAKNIAEANPSFAEGHLDFGYESYLRGDGVTAEKEFKRGLELVPFRKTEAFYYLGALSMESLDRNKAEYYFTEATKADPKNSMAQYSLATLLAGKDNKTALEAYDKFLATTELPHFHLLIEVKNTVSKLDRHRASVRRSPLMPSPFESSDTWKLMYLYPSGTELWYDPSQTRKAGDDIRVVVKQRLARLDRHLYALKILKFPLSKSAEAYFAFDIKCRRNLLKTESMEFRDGEGNLLGKIWPEKEYSIMSGENNVVYEYLLPHTIMRSFADKICNNS